MAKLTRTKGHTSRLGRPRKQFNHRIFEGLCRLQCTRDEIAGVLGISADTLERRCAEHYAGKTFAAVFAEKRVGGLVSLRRAQFKAAQSGNPTLLIWMGKQYLDQRDKMDIDLGELDKLLARELARVSGKLEAQDLASELTQ